MEKNRLIPGILVLMTAMSMASCGEDVAGGGSATGSIAPAVSIDAIVVGADVESRAADDPAPEVGDLSLRVTSEDGSFDRTWDRLADFSADEKFPVGYYNVEVSHGEPDAEGFDCSPAYYAADRIKVIEAVTVPVELTARRTQAEVRVVYTDAFKDYMSRATTRVETVTGHKSYFVTSSTFTEERSSLIAPGKTVVYVSFAKQSGAEANDIKVSEFTAEPRHRYIITVDVNNGGVGGPRLTVGFDDTVEDAETIDVDLSDENLFAAAPTLTIEGATDERIEFVEHSYTGDGVKVSVMAPGGISSVMLTTQSAFLRDKKGLPPTLELVHNDGDHGVSSSGIVVRGLDGTVDKMAVIDFTKMFDTFDYLDSDSEFGHVSTFKVEVTDRNGKTAESPVGFSMLLKPIEMSVDAVSELKFFETDLVADISYNGRQDNLSFVYVNDLGVDKPLTVNSITSKGENRYSVSLTGLPADANSVTVKVKAGIKSASKTVTRVAPAFSLSVVPNDIFARKAYVTVECQEVDPVRLAPYVTFYKGAARLTSTQVDGSATFLVEGLASDLDNTLTASLVGKSAEVCEGLTFHTEVARTANDGGFDVWSAEKKGDYQYLWKVGTTGNWATLNDLTTSQSGSGSGNGLRTGGCAYKATSGTIPANGRSTQSFESPGFFGGTNVDGHTEGKSDIHNNMARNGSANAALIRTVGWGKNNSAKAGSSSNQGFNECDNMTPGELYVGTYNGGPQYGIEFKSRPSALKFYYHYDPVTSGNGDFGTAEIAVYDSNGNTIASNKVELREQASYKEVTMPLTYNKGCEKAAKISVIFRSSGNAAALEKNTTFWHTPGGSNTSGGEYVGSELYIDDVDLIY